jgi:hypothetical protein
MKRAWLAETHVPKQRGQGLALEIFMALRLMHQPVLFEKRGPVTSSTTDPQVMPGFRGGEGNAPGKLVMRGSPRLVGRLDPDICHRSKRERLPDGRRPGRSLPRLE